MSQQCHIFLLKLVFTVENSQLLTARIAQAEEVPALIPQLKLC